MVQKKITAMIRSLNKDLTSSVLCLADTYNRVSFKHHKPDIVAYPRTLAPATADDPLPSPYYIVALGDVKGRRASKEEFTDTEIGELEIFLWDLLCLLPDRGYVVGFLTDGIVIQFFRLYRDPQLLEHSEVEKLTTTGGQMLVSMLYTKPEMLGANVLSISVSESTPNGQKLEHSVVLSSYLGHGASAVVWEARYGDKSVVAKVFFAATKGDCSREEENLTRVGEIADLHGRVPSLVAGGDQLLLLEPVGEPFAAGAMELVNGPKRVPLAEHFEQLLEILRVAHKDAGLVHRDLAPQNFFLHPHTNMVRAYVFAKVHSRAGFPQ